jgi:hypothetical protein
MARFLTLIFFLFSAAALKSPAETPPTTYRIGGIVVDAKSGQPLGLAEVTIASAADLEDVQTFLTAPDGRFLFTNLAAGKYRLTAGRRGYAVQGFNQHETYMTAIVTGHGQDTEHLRFRLSPSALLTGTISDQWNEPVREAEVTLFQQSWSAGSRGFHVVNKSTTDDLGQYRFSHLLPGTYAIAVLARPWWTSPTFQPVVVSDSGAQFGVSSDSETQWIEATQTAAPNPALDVIYPVTFFPNANSLADAAKLTLLPGSAEIADVALRPVPSLHLHVRVPPAASAPSNSSEDASDGDQNEGQTVFQANVGVALDFGEGLLHSIPATSTEISPGLFELSGIPPGQITLALQGSADESLRTQSLQLSVNTDVDFSPHGPLAEVSGVVLMNEAAPDPSSEEDKRPSFMLLLRSPKTGETYQTSVSRKGEFSYVASALPPGTYEVGLSNEFSFQVSSIEATGATVSHRTINIPGDQPVKLSVHTSEAKCSLAGFALKNGKPTAGAMILLVPQDPDQRAAQFHRDQSDSDGSFYMAPLFPGRYTLLAIENGWDIEWSNPAVLFQYFPSGQPIALQPNAAATLNAKVQ